MTRKSFHWREIEKSPDLQYLLELLKDLDEPLSAVDLSELSRPYSGARPRLANVATLLAELRKNPGYTCGGGLGWGKFPDGLYKYWLIEAPGWTPRWIVADEYRVVPYGSGENLRMMSPRSPEQESNEFAPPGHEPAIEVPRSTCSTCGKELPEDHTGPPWCKDNLECIPEWRRVAVKA